MSVQGGVAAESANRTTSASIVFCSPPLAATCPRRWEVRFAVHGLVAGVAYRTIVQITKGRKVQQQVEGAFVVPTGSAGTHHTRVELVAPYDEQDSSTFCIQVLDAHEGLAHDEAVVARIVRSLSRSSPSGACILAAFLQMDTTEPGSNRPVASGCKRKGSENDPDPADGGAKKRARQERARLCEHNRQPQQRVGFFWDRLNVHTFNCHRRADRRVEGLVTEGWVGGMMGGVPLITTQVNIDTQCIITIVIIIMILSMAQMTGRHCPGSY
jgi:hypothetical protein